MAGNITIGNMTSLDAGNVTSTLLVPVVKPGTLTNYHTQLGNLTAAVGSELVVTDGTHTVDNVTTLNFSGATVGGVSPEGNVTIAAAGIEITDGTHDVTGATKLTVTGGTVGGTTPNATLTVAGGGVPLPFVGTAPVVGWTRPSLATFSTGINLSGIAAQTGTDAQKLNGAPAAPGLGYAPADTVTLTGGTPVGGANTIITVDTIGAAGAIATCHITTAGIYSATPSNPVSQGSSSGPGTGATFDIGYAVNTSVDGAGGLPITMVTDANGYSVNGTAVNAYVTVNLKTIGAAPWTITTACAGIGNNQSTVDIFLPIFLYDSVTDKGTGFVWYTGGSLTILNYTGCSDPNTATAAFPPTLPSPVGFSFSDYFEWFRVVNDGTNLSFYVSQEGVLWILFYKEALTAFLAAIDHVGFGYDAASLYATGNGQNTFVPQYLSQAIALWQWTD